MTTPDPARRWRIVGERGPELIVPLDGHTHHVAAIMRDPNATAYIDGVEHRACDTCETPCRDCQEGR